MTSVGPLRPSFAVRARRDGQTWAVDLLAPDADSELPALERALGAPGEQGWPGSFVFVVDSRLYFIALTHGPGGLVRALISDVTSQEWVLAAEVVERYRMADGTDLLGAATVDDAFDDDETGWPAGDLDMFAEAGLPAADLAPILGADDLWAEEMVLRIAERLGFADQLLAAAAQP